MSVNNSEAVLSAPVHRIPLAKLRESKWNPRKYFPPAKQEQLTESMKRNGFWEWSPIMARPCGDGFFEIGAGHRRARSAKAAGLAEVPVVVREMSDEEFLRIVTFDNSNREDPHELDEAAGFRFYMKQTGATVACIASEIGQSEAYVYQRLKYADMIEAGQKAFWDEKITAGHAILIARLQPADQKRALDETVTRWRTLSVRDLMDWIERNIHRAVNKACFDSADAQLLAGVGACTDCPKRSGNSRELFVDVKNLQTCMDPACYSRKEQAFVQLQIAKRNTDPDAGKSALVKVSTAHLYGDKPPAGTIARDAYRLIEGKSDACPSARDAIVSHGDEKFGRVVRICDDKSCKKHRPGSSSFRRDPKELARERRRKEEAHRAKVVISRLRAAIAEKCPSPWTQRHLLLIARGIAGRMWHDLRVELVKAWKLEPIERKTSWGEKRKDYEFTILQHVKSLPVAQLPVAVIELALWEIPERELFGFAAEFEVDRKLIEKAVARDLASTKPVKKNKKQKAAA